MATLSAFMHWHAELTFELRLQHGGIEQLALRRYTLRGYHQPEGYAERRPYDAVLQADVLGDRAHLHALLRRDGAELSRPAMRSLAHVLCDHGVRWIAADRHGQLVVLPIERCKR